MLVRLKKLRIEKQISISEIANFLNISEKQYISYETTNFLPSVKELSKLAHFFNTSIDYLLEETDSKIPYKKNTSNQNK